jgi:hypothetical protein
MHNAPLSLRASPQLLLPLPPMAPCPAQVQAELVWLWRQHPLWPQRYSTVEALMADNQLTARALWACARQLVVQRQRELQRLHRPQTTT